MKSLIALLALVIALAGIGAAASPVAPTQAKAAGSSWT